MLSLTACVKELESEVGQLQSYNSQLLDDCRIVGSAALDRAADLHELVDEVHVFYQEGTIPPG